VFNVGDRLPVFTSPLGVLLPALASVLNANWSDQIALWIYRAMCIAALGGAALFLVRIGRFLDYATLAVVVLIAGIALDAKTLYFTINGQEIAFSRLFIAYAFWAHLTQPPRQWLHLGVAWAGMMWARPDGFVYAGLIGLGFFLFNDRSLSGCDRRTLFISFVKAGLTATALFLPWLLFTLVYYGTVIPHSITAKAGLAPPHSLGAFLLNIAPL
jgi:hypothetical protein